MQDKAAPLFILGAPRSGTSLLYRALALHPDTAWISNYGRRLPVLPEIAMLNRLAGVMPRTRRRVWFGEDGGNAYRYGTARSLVERVFPQPVEGEPVFEHRGVLPQGDRSDCTARQLRLRGDVDRLVRAAGGRLLLSKRIGHNLRVGLLDAVFPEARFIVMTRDGRAVARSLLAVDWWPDHHVWWYGGTPRDWAATGGAPAELAAHHWVHEVAAIEAGLSGVDPARVLRVRYEDLVAAPHDVLAGTAAFAGLAADATWRAELGGVRFPNRNGDPTDVDPSVDRIQAETLRALEYA